MRRTAIRLAALTALLMALCLASGCIVQPEWWDHRPPRRAVVHVYVYDYYTYQPVSWAEVELYEDRWWFWEYLGTWQVDASGYTAVRGGYLYYDGYEGPEERDLGIEVYANGYYPERYELELDYWDPVMTLTFYLLPWSECGDCWTPREGEPQKTPGEWELPENRLKVGVPKTDASADGE